MAESLPPSLNEWLNWAERLMTADLYTRDDYRALVVKLSDAEILEMGEAYKRGVRDNTIATLKAWLLSHRGDVPMSREELALRNLLYLWRRLSNQTCAPFSKGPVLDIDQDCRPTPDWSKLPPNLRFLAVAASMCGKFTYSSSSEGRDYIVRAVTPEERRILQHVAEDIRRLDLNTVNRWVSPLLNYHIEARLVANLISVMDALDLPYFERGDDQKSL